jgi:hypothetical protein
MQFEVTYQRDEITRKQFTVGAKERAIVGVYVNGIPFGPDGSAIYHNLPYAYRKAFDRAHLWLGRGADGREVFRADLWDSRHKKPLGSVFVRPLKS